MKVRKPDYYDTFECLGGPCPDNCCIGDELVLDEETFRLYMTVPGAFGDRLRRVLKEARKEPFDGGSDGEEPDPAMPCDYCLTVDGRCPFLNAENYCEIVLNLGPEALGEVCAGFPRTEDWFYGCLERNLMPACPEQARILLTREAPARFIICEEPETVKKAPAGDDGIQPDPEDAGLEAAYAALREEVIDILTDRGRPLLENVREAAALCGLTGCPLISDLFENEAPDARESRLTILAELPWQHRSWPEAFELLETSRRKAMSSAADAAFMRERTGVSAFAAAGSHAVEQLLIYFVFRYLPWAIDDGDPAGKLSFALFSVLVIADLARAYALNDLMTSNDRGASLPALSHLVKAVTTWSKEIEFSEENLFYLFDMPKTC